MACLVMVPAALVAEAPWAIEPDGESVAAAVYLWLFPTAFATILFFYLVQMRGASFMAFVNYLVPVFGVLWGVGLLSEPVREMEVAGLIIILAGIAVAHFKRPKKTGAA